MLPVADVVAAWPFAASLAAAATARTLWQGRRRTVLNEALHELRRPLQALALVAPEPGAATPDRLDASLRMATAALERLDREINGAAAPPVREVVPARPLVEAAVERWRPRARRCGSTLELRWRAAAATIGGDGAEIAQALDNLIVNAIEHGGRRIEVRATLGVGWLRLAVLDSGRGDAPNGGRAYEQGGAAEPGGARDWRRRGPERLVARLSGRRRHGHGLRVVRRTVTAHDGQFALRSSARGTEAVLELPLLSGEAP